MISMIILNLTDLRFPSLITTVPLTIRNLKWKYLLNANYGPKVGSIHKMVHIKLIWDSPKRISEERSATKPFQIVSFPHAKVSPKQILPLYNLLWKSWGYKEQTQEGRILIQHLIPHTGMRRNCQTDWPTCLCSPHSSKRQVPGHGHWILPTLCTTQQAIYHGQDAGCLSDINIVTELEKGRNCGL